jgi:hypothetical protein
MPGRHISPRRRHYVYRLRCAGFSCSQINKQLRKTFGAMAGVSHGSITNIWKDGEAGDACPAVHRFKPGRSLTEDHVQCLEGALERDSSLMTEELQDELVANEPAGGRTSHPLQPGRSHHFPASTIDDTLRLRGITHKCLSQFDGRRCARLSARVRNALRGKDPKKVGFIDACCLRAKDFQRRTGRSRKGRKARAKTTAFSNGGVLKTIMGVFTLDGFVAGPTRILDGPVNTEAYMEWAHEFLSPWLEPGMTIVL